MQVSVVRAVLLCCSLLLITGCATTLQTRASGIATTQLNAENAFALAKNSALDAGFTIMTADKDSGLIIATRGANALLAWQNPVINRSTCERGSGSEIRIASTVGAQRIDYGVTKATIDDFCNAMRGRATANALCKRSSEAAPRIRQNDVKATC